MELNWWLACACYIGARLCWPWRYAFWTPMLWGLTATLANGIPRSNAQMIPWQEFMLMLSGLTVWFAVLVGARLRWGLLGLAFALGMSGQLICVLIWRYWGYNACMWMVSWTTALLLLWQAGKVPWAQVEEPAALVHEPVDLSDDAWVDGAGG